MKISENLNSSKVRNFRSVNDFLDYFKLDSPKFFNKFDEILIKSCRSSYFQHGFGHVFSAMTYNFQFEKILELGVLDGYSLLSMAHSCSIKGQKNTTSIIGADLFDDYEYRNGKLALVQNLVDRFLFTQFVTLMQGDVFTNDDIMNNLESANLIHVDLSNDGIKVENVMSILKKRKDFVILFEGGTPSRDRVDWMIRYEKKPMNPYFEELSTKDEFKVSMIHDYPGLTIVSPKDYIF